MQFAGSINKKGRAMGDMLMGIRIGISERNEKFEVKRKEMLFGWVKRRKVESSRVIHNRGHKK